MAAARAAIDHLDEYVPKILKGDIIAGDAEAAGATLETARGDYAAAKTAERLDKKTSDAEIRAASAHSGENVANRVRQKMAEVLTSDKQKRGLRPDELEATEQLVRGTKTQNALRWIANKTGTHAATAAGAATGSIFGPGGAAVGAVTPLGVGWAMKSVANRMTLKQAEKLSEMVRSRAPLASSMAKFEEKAGAFKGGQSPATMAGVALAARNFSNNLRSAGINISPSDLIKELQGSTNAGADDEQPKP